VLGIDWERTTLSEYYEALEAHNEADNKSGPISEKSAEELRAFNKAHGMN
jgi:hypothetical protein